MSKKLNEWLDEFVENGADASDVTKWPENAGGNIDLSPLVIAKAGMKIYMRGIDWCSYPQFYNFIEYGDFVSTNDYPSNQLGVSFSINEAHTQIIAQLVFEYDYQTISNAVVIYEGENIPSSGRLEDLQVELPDLEFTIDDSFTDTYVFRSSYGGVSN